ncbi:MAG: efflux RND transporter permease subunit [Candidatus Eremiobacteraeota bacterium]|nr:efflux RND transporter permease subunit [Candidatus Eremiobacteraeota bacterium]
MKRPILASVASLIILLVGLVSIPLLPVAQFPAVAPPTITVQAVYLGASAEAVEASVTTPLEQALNGLEGLRYISSQSGNDGVSTITLVFNLDRNLDQAANDVQNAVNLAQGRLPNEIKQTGITVFKNSGSFIMAIGLSTDGKIDATQLSNYVDLNVANELRRIPGVGNILIFGERKYAMRLWIDPRRLADNGLAAGDVVKALQEQNVQVAAGSIGAPPTLGHQPFEMSVRATGRLTSPADFKRIILKTTPDGGRVTVGQIGRVEIGAESYATNLRFDRHASVGLGVQQLPNGNALDVSRRVIAKLDELQRKFPAGVKYKVAFDATDFVRDSIHDVTVTLFIAILLVIGVIFLFLQDWRTTLIPAITIPISLIGTFGLMRIFGFSINTLTLFGLTLATGLVVDDAIVVIENISRFIYEKGMPPFKAATEAMREISGAVVATSLVLLSVFIPVGFFPGTTGALYKQFALTIACAIAISLFNALTLTPVLSALLLGRVERPKNTFFMRVNKIINGTRKRYDGILPAIISRWPIVLGLFIAALVFTGFMYKITPTGFVPDEDQGFMIVASQAPEGTSADSMLVAQKKIEDILFKQPEITDVFDVGGFGFTGNGSNHSTMFVRLQPLAERGGGPHSAGAVVGRLFGQLSQVTGAQSFPLVPPAINGLGFQGGFFFELQDRGNIGILPLAFSAYQMMGMAAKDPALSNTFTTYTVNSPQLVAQIDREKAKNLGIPLDRIFQTMQVYLGSVYVNDFDYLNRSYRVYVEADAPFRSSPNDLQNIFVRSDSGGTVPLSSLMLATQTKVPPVITHFNLFRSVELNGQPGPGFGSTDAINEMQKLQKLLPPGTGFEWSGLSREQIEGGSTAGLIFLLGIIFTYLVLAAQYESFIDPLIILLSVPLALLGALGAIFIRNFFLAGLTHTYEVADVYAQVGFVMLVGLASKNAILIVEFANQLRAQGHSIADAVIRASETRLRPILMTSIAFILGIFPLVIATGNGSASRNSLGTVVFGGMLVSTFLNLFVVPVLYVLIISIEERIRPRKHKRTNGQALVNEPLVGSPEAI